MCVEHAVTLDKRDELQRERERQEEERWKPFK